MRKILLILIIMGACASCHEMRELPTVKRVELDRYMGKWYEIARLPNSFEKGLVCVTAEYSLKSNGKVRVLNSGRSENDTSRIKTAKGTAKVPNKDQPGRLKVTFFWPFYGNYYIIELDEDYQYALVGDPSRQYLWILSRKPEMDAETYMKLESRAKELGFAVEALLKVRQDCNN